MNKYLLFFLLTLTTLTVSAWDKNSPITDKEFGIASINKDIKSTEINGQTFYYVEVQDRPYLAVIVEKKKAYKNYKEVVLPGTFTTPDGKTMTIAAIGNKAFQKCRSIKTVVLPGTVRIIGDEAFCNTDIDSLSLQEGIAKIGDRAFYNNDLRSIYIPEGVEEIGMEAFYCYKSTIFQRSGTGKLYIPKSVYKIGDHAFAMARNGYGVWFNSRRDILCLPDHVNLENCKKMGISRDPVKAYLKNK